MSFFCYNAFSLFIKIGAQALKYLSFFFFLFLSVNVTGKWFCEWNTLNEGAEVTLKDSPKFIKRFFYSPEDAKGQKFNLGKNELQLWKNKEGNFLRILDDRTHVLTTSLSDQQSRIVVFYGKNKHRFHCETKKFADDFDSIDLEKHDRSLKFTVKNRLFFPLEQKEEAYGMRVLFFQGKKKYESFNKLDSKLPWCSLRIKIFEEKTVIANRSESYQSARFDLLKNNDYFKTYSYTFVDPVKAKTTLKFKDYAPLSIECSYFLSHTFNKIKFKEIVGDYFDISF